MTKPDGEYSRSGIDIRTAKRGQEIVNCVQAGFAILTGGGSELIAPAIRKIMDKRISELRDALLDDLSSGAIDLNEVIREDDLASFIIRIQRAAIEGCAKQKLKLMIRHFFRKAPAADYREDMFLNFAGITEQLSHDEIKSLAIIKNAIRTGQVSAQPESRRGDVNSQEGGRRLGPQLDVLGLFTDQAAFNTAAASLVRFGFLQIGVGWGTLVLSANDQLFTYLDTVENQSCRLLGTSVRWPAGNDVVEATIVPSAAEPTNSQEMRRT